MNLTGSVWLSGDLGAGKTTLTRYWFQAMGHTGAVKALTLPWLSLYQIRDDGTIKPVYHADLYRLNDPEELEFIGFMNIKMSQIVWWLLNGRVVQQAIWRRPMPPLISNALMTNNEKWRLSFAWQPYS